MGVGFFAAISIMVFDVPVGLREVAGES